MFEAYECAQMEDADFSYPFLKGVDLENPPSHIDIPAKYFDLMGNMERQYWEIKAKRYNVLIFFKKGKFYELYDHDAVVASREFGLKMTVDTTNRGKMRLAGVPEQTFSEWARLFVYRGYKVGRVEQLHEDCSLGATKLKVLPRELVEVLTPGTLTDPAMLADHQAIFLLAVTPESCHPGVVDCFAVDLSRHIVLWCPCGDFHAVCSLNCKLRGLGQAKDVGGSMLIPTGQSCLGNQLEESTLQALAALLQQLCPKEIIMMDLEQNIHESEDGARNKRPRQLVSSLFRWIESEGYPVERIPPTVFSMIRDSDCTGKLQARLLMESYFRFLKLDRELPLLEEAQFYTDHLSGHGGDEVPVPAGVTKVSNSSNCTAFYEKSGFVAWERRYDSGLVLDAVTVSNLEIVTNLRDGSEAHSLHQTLNHCLTNGGKRLFRAWLLRPASTDVVIERRQEAVRFFVEHQLDEEIWNDALFVGRDSALSSQCPGAAAVEGTPPSALEGFVSCGARVSSSLRKRPRADLASRFLHLAAVDFERSLSRLAELKTDEGLNISYVDPLMQYRKNLSIILTTVQAFREMIDWACSFDMACRRRERADSLPVLLVELVAQIQAAAPSVSAMESLFDQEAASRTKLLTPSRGTSPDYDAAVDKLALVEASLHKARERAQSELFHGAPVVFADLGKDLFLLEVAVRDAPRITPHGLVERARNAKSVRYVMNALGALVEAHKEASAAKSAALLKVLRQVAAKICEQCPALYTAISALSYCDCLMNLARLWGRYPVMCFPKLSLRKDAANGEDRGLKTEEMKVHQGAAFLRAQHLLHPTIALSHGIPNSIALDDEKGRLLILTGPNMAGKSTLMRTVAVNVILAQLGGPVLGSVMSFSPIQRIFTRIGARDVSHKGQSTLYVELSEAAEILRKANGRSLCLIDELGRGTSTHDGLAIAHATLQALKDAIIPAPLTIFSTHYHALALEQERCNSAASLGSGENDLISASSTRGDLVPYKKVQLGYMDFALGSGKEDHATQDAVDPQTSLHSKFQDHHGGDTTSGSNSDLAVPALTFLYKLVSGICTRSYGVEVALMAGIPPSLVYLAKQKSEELARLTALHEDVKTIGSFFSS